MILTDREIQSAIACGEIVIEPQPGPSAFSSTSLDLTLGADVREWDTPVRGVEQVIAPAQAGCSYTEIAKRYTTPKNIANGGFILEPGKFILAWTSEKVGLPIRSQVAARVEGKSSLARLGIVVHLTAPTIHAGFGAAGDRAEGTHLQLEMCNHGTLRVRLEVGMPVCQLIFEQTLGTPQKGYSGQFAQQKAT